jgi:glucosamine--fructose-6-phosphate aminotransferase (isomerizing)
MIQADHTRMFMEAASASHAVSTQLEQDAQSLRDIGAQLRALKPRAVVTCARGSSDHAATYAKYLIETRARVLVASAAPSVNSVYGVTQDLEGCLFLVISQSGRSPDLLASAAAARASGATVLALCNSPDSPLTKAADLTIDLRAGLESSVAATKSYLATLAAIARLVAEWTEDRAFMRELEALPALMQAGWNMDWSAAGRLLARTSNLYVVGRGVGLAAAQEIALKCKETCGLHAEAFSSAEVKHGPYALLGPDFPALVFAQDDASLEGVRVLAQELLRRDVPVLLAGTFVEGCVNLKMPEVPADLAPILMAQSAYRMLAQLAVARGFDPDRPPFLNKVTETV